MYYYIIFIGNKIDCIWYRWIEMRVVLVYNLLIVKYKKYFKIKYIILYVYIYCYKYILIIICFR